MIVLITFSLTSRGTKLCCNTDKSGLTNTPPLKAASGSLSCNGWISAFIPSGGRPLVMVKAMSACLSWFTASIARAVNNFSLVTSVPSTSAITRRIGWVAIEFPTGISTSQRLVGLLFFVVAQQPAVHKNSCAGHVIGVAGCQECSYSGNIFRGAEPLQRDVLEQ